MPAQHKKSFFSLPNTPNLVIIIVLLVYMITNFTHHKWTFDKGPDRAVISWDIISYYAYLPATFIYGDVGLRFTDDPGFVNDNKFWFHTTDEGKKLIITSMGLSFVYAPFFALAHLLAPVFGEPRSGFNSIYQFFLIFSALFYVGMGLIFLRKILRRYFDPPVVALTLLTVGLGTNLYYYSTYEAPMAHSYNFALITVFLYLTILWHERITLARSILTGLFLGLVTLIRPTNILVVLIFILWNVASWNGLVRKSRTFLGSIPHVLIMALAFLLVWTPQFLYWEHITGQFLFYSYGPHGDRFFFANPHLFEILFSYRKGWLFYTPLMLFALGGIDVLGKSVKGSTIPILTYILLMIFLQGSWWTWWFGGSYGSRVFIDTYGILALPLAAMIRLIVDYRHKWLKPVLAGVFVFLIFLQLFQTQQYVHAGLHYEGMTGKAYWNNFLRVRPHGEYWNLLSIPDKVLARESIYVYYPTGEDASYLVGLDRDERLALICGEIRDDRTLVRDIRLYAKREGIPPAEAMERVAERMLSEKIEMHGLE